MVEKYIRPLVFISESWVRASKNFIFLAQQDELLLSAGYVF